jgi:membrane dipeptidase
MLIIDGHEDLAWNALALGRDITRPLAEIRAAEGPAPAHGEGVATVSLPALREAGVAVVLATIFATPAGDTPVRQAGYRTPEEAHAQGVAQLAWYADLHARGEATLIRTQRDLHGVLDGTRPRPGLVLTLEGADPLRTPRDLGVFLAGGVRFVGLAWGATRYAGGTRAPGGLTADGVNLLAEMARLGVVMDASHLAEAAFWQAMDLFPGRVVATHANCRALVPTDRLLSDAMIGAIAARGGVIGMVFYNRFIRADVGDAKPNVGYADLLPHARRIADIAGVAHLGLGTDLDGGVGREVTPRELDSVADLPRLADTLTEAFSASEVEGIMGGHWRRLLLEVLPP